MNRGCEFDDLPLFEHTVNRFTVNEEKTKGTAKQVINLLKDGKWHTTNEMLHHSTHRFSCGIHWLRQRGYDIVTRGNTKTEFDYQLVGRTEMVRTKKSIQELYYKTQHWDHRRRMRRQYDNDQCCMCKRSGSLHVHHWLYDLFYERLEDLMTLCEDCHAKVHGNPAIKIAFPKSLALEVIQKIETSETTSHHHQYG